LFNEAFASPLPGLWSLVQNNPPYQAPAPRGSPLLPARGDTAAGGLLRHRAMHGWCRRAGREGLGRFKQNVTMLGHASAEASAAFQAWNSWTKGREQITAVPVPQSKSKACV